MTPTPLLRLMTKVARLYYEQGLRQAEIADRLDLSQSRVSRLLKQAEREGIVRITVAVPQGFHAELEDRLQVLYGLREAVVVDCEHDDDQEALRAIGAAAAAYLETTLTTGEILGISSWSETLLAMLDNMHPQAQPGAEAVVQILGGSGNPAAEGHATRLTSRLAQLVGGEARFLPAPGVVGSRESRRALLDGWRRSRWRSSASAR
jgi:DNA-binding transcriptional regulator LsrR (DeoR family)